MKNFRILDAISGSQDLLVKVVRAVGPWASIADGHMENWGNMFSWGRCLWSFHIETMLSWFPFQGETRIIYPLVNLSVENGPFIGELPIKNGDVPWILRDTHTLG